MATQFRQPGHPQQHFDYQVPYEPTVHVPMRSNAGLIAGLVLAMGAILTLLVYYVL